MFKGTTILCVRRGNKVAIAGDGQVTLGSQIIKASAKKVRRIGDAKVIAGFAGSTSDAMTLLERFEKRLDENQGHLLRAAAALMKEWRTDKYLRRLEAMMVVADKAQTFILSGVGDVLEPEGGVASIGSGSGYALAAARALMDATDLEADEIARRGLLIASEICIYTNNQLTLEVIEG
ncbi:MAG: ATP-dependent protease subunit HslV [Synergistaceae bacterium]|nr:ATP-dependent protease subunit HslV [Synergistaceae bacterium]